MSESVAVSGSVTPSDSVVLSDSAATPTPQNVGQENLESSPLSTGSALGFSSSAHLCLAAVVSFYPDKLVFSQCGTAFAYQCGDALAPILQRLFLLMDGSRSLATLKASFLDEAWEAIAEVLHILDTQNLLDDVTPIANPEDANPEDASPKALASSLKQDPSELLQQLIEERLATNAFWQSLSSDPQSLSGQVLYGLALELNHYYSECSAFQSPLRDFQLSRSARQAFTHLCQAQQAQPLALAQALASLEIDHAAAADHLPLPETVSLVNALAFWAQTEPQFALSLQSTLSQCLAELFVRFQTCCEQSSELTTEFVDALGAGMAVGLDRAIAALDTAYAAEFPLLSDSMQQPDAMQQRFIGQAHLFAALYSNWLAAISAYYGQAPQLQRSLLTLECGGLSLERPRLKEGVLLRFTETALEVRGKGQGIAIALTQDEQSEMQQFLRYLQVGGFSQDELADAAPGMGEQVEELLQTFGDRGWLATDMPQRPLSGQQFYRELERFLTRFKQQFPPSPMMQKMVDGTITREQLIGYSLESYHVTHLCPRLLAPALGQFETAATQALLHEFFTSELHHDTLVENSLKSVGISLEQIHTMQPLPMTFAVCSSLGVFARRHSLSFKSALMLFEEDDKTFHQLFEQRCKDLELPPGFYRPILLHAHINEDGEHDQITKVLLEELPMISVAEQQLVKKNLIVLLTSMVLRTHEILDYYGNAENLIPRCF